MPKKTQAEQRGYLLPETINPPQVPICICIPCDRNHALAFLGQINDLGYWWNWERDELKQGTEAARVWRQIYDDVDRQLRECGVFDMGCGCNDKPTRQRINEDGFLEVSYDDGETWQIDTADDPRFSNPILPEPSGGVDKCIAANSIVTALQELQQQEYEALLAGTNLLQTLYNIAAAFIGLVIAAPIALIPAIIALLISALINIIADQIPEDFDDAFTEATWQDLLCILYCEMEADGSFTSSSWLTVKDRVVSEIGGYAGITWLHDTINLMGVVGLTNASRLGYGGSRDCSGCDCATEWCYLFDFAASGDEDWEALASGGSPFGVFVSGQYWNATDEVDTISNPDIGARMVYIGRDMDARTITRIVVTYDLTKGSYDSPTAPGLGIATDAGSLLTRGINTLANGTNLEVEWSGSAVAEQVTVFIRASRDQTSPYVYSGMAHIKAIRIEGLGANPFGANNCPE